MAMTRDDVIRMAREAGIPIERAQFSQSDDLVGSHGRSQLQRFADLIVKAEREACAAISKEAMKGAVMSKYATMAECMSARDMAETIDKRIRARGVE